MFRTITLSDGRVVNVETFQGPLTGNWHAALAEPLSLIQTAATEAAAIEALRKKLEGGA